MFTENGFCKSFSVWKKSYRTKILSWPRKIWAIVIQTKKEPKSEQVHKISAIVKTCTVVKLWCSIKGTTKTGKWDHSQETTLTGPVNTHKGLLIIKEIDCNATFNRMKLNKTGVINDPLGQTRSLVSSENCFLMKFALFC